MCETKKDPPENRLVVAKEKQGGRGEDWEFGTRSLELAMETII